MRSRVFQLLRDLAQQRKPFIIQAPTRGGITTPRLVAAVSNAGALGSLATEVDPNTIVKQIRAIKKATSAPFAISADIMRTHDDIRKDSKALAYQRALNPLRLELGLPIEYRIPRHVLPQDDLAEIVHIAMEEDIGAVIFSGMPADCYIPPLKRRGIFLIGTATSLAEAKAFEKAGFDAIVAKGIEAAGDLGDATSPPLPTMTLTAELAVSIKIPIIAEGGIMRGDHIAKAMSHGAIGVQMATAFLPTEESGASKLYKKQLLDCAKGADGDDPTIVTKVVSGRWTRVLKTPFIKKLELAVPDVPSNPIPYYLSALVREKAEEQGVTDMTVRWCGQGVRWVRDGLTVQQLIDKLHQEFYNAEKSSMPTPTSSVEELTSHEPKDTVAPFSTAKAEQMVPLRQSQLGFFVATPKNKDVVMSLDTTLAPIPR